MFGKKVQQDCLSYLKDLVGSGLVLTSNLNFTFNSASKAAYDFVAFLWNV